jgi:predicted dehydrogenase
MAEQVTFGIIGAGGIARNQHLPNLTRAPHVRLKTVCDLKPELTASAQKDYGVPHATQDHRAVLADPEIRAVVIATREDMHVPLAIEALEAGKHVYVEKPLANTPEACERLLAVQRRTKGRVAVGFNRRMAPAYQLLRRIFAAHGGGRNIHYRIADAYWLWGRGYEPGTRVIHEVCHVFDLLRYLTGSEVASVYCAASRADDETLALRFANGCVASIMNSGYATWDMPKEHLEAVVDIGSVVVTEFTELRTFGLRDFDRVYTFAGHTHPHHDIVHRYLFAKGGAPALLDLRRVYWETRTRLEELQKAGVDSPERRDLEEYVNRHAPHLNYSVDKGWLAAVDHFAESILTGGTCELAGAEDGLRAAQLSEAAIRSRESGEVVRLG